MDRFVVFTDDVLDEIERTVAAHRPERGGALLGPVGQPVVTQFLHDTAAATSGSTFRPSRSLQAAVTRIEQRQYSLELKGMLHSHPGAMNHPSPGDRTAFADSLRGAPWLGRLVAPIVTCGTVAGGPHEVALPSGTMSVYVSEQTANGRGVDVQPAVVRVLPIARHTEALSRRLGGRPAPRGWVEMDGATYLTTGVLVDGVELQLLIPAGYPTQAPMLLAVPGPRTGPEGRRLLAALLPDGFGDGVAAVPLRWDLSVPEDERLVRSVAPPPAASDEARKAIRKRLDGAESPVLSARAVLIAGAGSGGSLTADALARSGVERFVLVDADRVAPENVSRSIYRMADVGTPKVEALRRHLRAINPLVTCDVLADRVQDVPREVLDKLVGDADLVVAATDDAAAQRLLDHFAYARGVPAVFGGVYAKAHAGEVVFTVKGLTRCYRCTTTGRHQDESQRRSTDYGTGQLAAEPALGADIQHIVTAAVKVAIGLLQLDDETATSSSRDLVLAALTAGNNYAILSTVPRYGFFPRLFASTPGQLGYQSVWMGAQGDENCVVCGHDPLDPLAAVTQAPDVGALRPIDGEPA